jgi:hypothetical protein
MRVHNFIIIPTLTFVNDSVTILHGALYITRRTRLMLWKSLTQLPFETYL